MIYVENPRLDMLLDRCANGLASLIGYGFGAAYLAFTYLGVSGLWLVVILLLLIWGI